MKVLGELKESESIRLQIEVKARLQSYLSVLDANYGANWDLIKNLSGYAVIVKTEAEIEEIKCGDGQVYCSSLFIV